MAVMSEFSKERKNIKNAPFKVKLQYFWDYYKWYVIIPLVIVVALSNYIYHLVTDPDTILNGVMLNCGYLDNDEELNEFLQNLYETYEIDTKEEEITFNTSLTYSITDNTNNYNALQALMAWSSAGVLDFMCADKDTLTELAYKGYFTDLRDVLSEEEIALYEPYFQYIDQDVVNQITEASNNLDNDFTIEYPDCSKPEDMKEPIPVMLDVSASKLMNIYADSTETLSFGFQMNSEHTDMTLKMIDYIFDDE